MTSELIPRYSGVSLVRVAEFSFSQSRFVSPGAEELGKMDASGIVWEITSSRLDANIMDELNSIDQSTRCSLHNRELTNTDNTRQPASEEGRKIQPTFPPKSL